VTVENAAGPGVRASQSSFVLEHSRLLGNRGAASVLVTQGSRAVLVGNDIQGRSSGVLVQSGGFLSDPLWAPSGAWLFRNVIHDNQVNGLWVRDKGSEVLAIGNRYEANRGDGVVVAGGATYTGGQETMTRAAGSGVTVRGCDLRCPDTANCSDPVVVQEATDVTLDSATVRDNQGNGLWAACGATVILEGSSLSGNGECGAKAEITAALDGAHWQSAPTSIRSSDSEFAGNRFDGLWLLGKGATGRGHGNRFHGNSWGLHVSGGASYLGERDSVADNLGVGVSVFGNELLWTAPDSSSPEIVGTESRVELEDAAVRRNFHGVVANCGAVIKLRTSFVTSSQDTGAIVGSTCDWGEFGLSSAPSILDSRRTVFAGNPGWGAIAYGDSRLVLGSSGDPGRNSFLENGAGSIANLSPDPVHAQWNWFGTADAAAIASSIVDCRADPSFGCVAYAPFLKRQP
jgi:hypothetical protein